MDLFIDSTILSPWATIASQASLASNHDKVGCISIRSSFVRTLFGMMFTSLAIAAAVGGWSPVTMITFIPADLHSRIALGTLSFGGSINETSPQNWKLASLKLNLGTDETIKWVPLGYSLIGRWSFANPSTRSPPLPNWRFTSLNFYCHAASILTA